MVAVSDSMKWWAPIRAYLGGALVVWTAVVVATGCAEQKKAAPDPALAARAEANPALTNEELAAAGLTGHIVLCDATLGPGDEVALEVYRHSGLDRKLRVPVSGVLFFPLVGELSVQNLSALELRRIVSQKLDKYIVDPQVSVTVTLNRSEKVMVFGEVRRPGVYLMQSPTRALEALLMAGGYTNEGSERRVILLRLEGGQVTSRVLNIEKALQQADWEQNPILKKGDILFVPKSTATQIDRIARHLSTWLNPILGTEAGMSVGWDLSDRFGSTGVYRFQDAIP
jgi:polysaccharide biosynthesis/export protein